MSIEPAKPQLADRQTSSAAFASLGTLNWFNAVLSLVLVAGLTLYLWPQWQHNPDLSHGWFTPLVFVLLIHEARTRATQRFLPKTKLGLSAIVICLLSGLLLLAAGGLYMAALEWTHALVAVMLTAGLCALLMAAWIAVAAKDVRLVPFNWAAGVAIFLWLLSTPLPPGTYATLTQTLQTGVTRVVLGLLHFLGIAAVRHGNIIQLTTVSVGVEEACSGVRSLLSCVYAGFFFSAALVKRPWSRVLIVTLAAPLAIVMNIVRSFTLTLLAHKGVDISGAWHDITGFAILGVTAALLAGIAVALEHRSAGVLGKPRQAIAPSLSSAAETSHRPQWLVAGGLTLAVIVVTLFILNTRPADNLGRTPPSLAAILPAKFENWEAIPSNELFQFSAQLQTTYLAQTTYNRKTPHAADPLEITVYLAYWPVGQAPVSLVASHTPDACWPGSGWAVKPQNQPRSPLTLPGRVLDDAEFRIFAQQGFTQYVWYWHIYDGRVIHLEGVRSPRQLLLLALRYGFRRNGDQLFVRVSSNQPWEKISSEPLLQEIFARLAPFGL